MAPRRDKPLRVSLYALHITEEGGEQVLAVLRRHAEHAGWLVAGEHHDALTLDAPEHPAWRAAWAEVTEGRSRFVFGGDRLLLLPPDWIDEDTRREMETLAFLSFRQPGPSLPLDLP
ncbi:hypothetical protein GT204_19755 [Streptomyces sp. SID4919]|uniref:hypothetical protein n=1 Tax=unclassified Streptomyces TaxID=2593676 RepID=UPI000823D3D0|nr:MULTISPECIES: hypothetical protein [unclassified Streptomyces]MYY11084.1 hypothetical protein [Streptomyces sp. SID4919]SCK15203.1 hypothetical protein YW7DRAFT_00962 [Streptomyces sp. AmelKG-E11A]